MLVKLFESRWMWVSMLTLLSAIVIVAINVASAPAASAASKTANGCTINTTSYMTPLQGGAYGNCWYPNRNVRAVVSCSGRPPLSGGEVMRYSSWNRTHPRAYMRVFCPEGYWNVRWAGIQEQYTWWSPVSMTVR